MVTYSVNLTWSGSGFIRLTQSFFQSPPLVKGCLNSLFHHSCCKNAFLTEFFWSYFKYKYKTILNMHFIDEKYSKIFSLISWGIFILSAFYVMQVKLYAIW